MALIKIDITKELRGIGPADLLVLVVLVALVASLMAVGHQWAAPYQACPDISLSVPALVHDCFLSLARNFAAYFISLFLAFWWGIWAAKSRAAERILIPVVDILQSIPVLGFMPCLVLGLVPVFPDSRVGLELACILMILTSQAWNMILSVYQSVKSIPPAMIDMVENAQFSRRQRFLNLELPYCMTPLVWNSMLSMGNGWFFVIVTEAFVLNNRDFRIPGIGSYMSVAMEQGNGTAMAYGMLAMAAMVVLLDQLFWKPLVVWADRFRVDDQLPLDPGASQVLAVIGKSRVINGFWTWAYERLRRFSTTPRQPDLQHRREGLQRFLRVWGSRIRSVLGVVFLSLLVMGAWRLLEYFQQLSLARWAWVFGDAALTLGRILLACLLCAIWAIPLGVKIGLNSRLSKIVQPLIQVLNSYPAPLLFPAMIVVFSALGINFEVASILLMMVATVAYLLFNVIEGAAKISQDYRDAWACYGPKKILYWKKFILPAIFPSLVTGFNTMMATAWNATIVTEYLRLNGRAYVVGHGLGATINLATEAGDLALLTASVFVMSALVVTLNRVFWIPLSDYATKFSD